MLSLGFKQSILDNFFNILQANDKTYLLSLYVDENIIAGTSLENLELKKFNFFKVFDNKDLTEINHFLDMMITRSSTHQWSGSLRQLIKATSMRRRKDSGNVLKFFR